MFVNMIILVLVVALVQIALSSIWYSPILFGNFWMRINGMEETIKNATKEERKKIEAEAIPFYMIQAGLQVFMNICLYLLIHWVNQFVGINPYYAILLSFSLWVGVMVPLLIQNEIWGSLVNKDKVFKVAIVAGQLLISTIIALVTFSIF